MENTINGKEVTKILIDGKEFMTGDTKTAMKNLPASIIEKIKTYEEKSDFAKATGVDDGEEQTVLDFGIKQGMNKGVFGNADVAAGTKSRYAERLMGALFKDDLKLMGFANFNNTNDMGFSPGGGRGGFGQSNNGLNALKMAGVNLNYEKKNKLTVDAHARWNHADGDVATTVSTEDFVGSASSFGSRRNNTYTRSNDWNAGMRLEWKPDTLTTITFRPDITLSTADKLAAERSAAYSANPYTYGEDPLSAAAIAQMSTAGVVVNTRDEQTIGYSDNKKLNAMLQVSRKLNSNGRSITLHSKISHTDTQAYQLSTSNVHLYQVLNQVGNDSTYQTNRYMRSPEKNTSFSIKATYSEPVGKQLYVLLNYQFQYGVNRGTRNTYDFSNLGEHFFTAVQPVYRGWNSYLALLPNAYDTYWDARLSRSSEYTGYTHDIEPALKMVRRNYQLIAGLLFQPQHTHFVQQYQGVYTDTTRAVFNFAPTFDFRYKFSDVSKLRLRYRGRSAQPTLTQLLDIRDDSNPLNIYQGNPALKPAFTHSLRFFYDNYIERRQRAIMTFLNFSATQHAISDKITYDPATGGMLTRPENINGNWDVSGVLMFNTAIDSAGIFNFNTFSNIKYNHYAAYLATGSNSVKSITHAFNAAERASVSYRNSWMEAELNGSVDYTHSSNRLQTRGNLNTWQFSYGTTLTFNMPWKMQVSMGLSQNSRRGFADKALNTDELVWNAQVSQSFLKESALTVSLQLYDILQNRSSVSRTITALQRSDTQYNTIHSYAMLHVIYKINLFGGKDARNEMKNRPGVGRFGNIPPAAPGGMGREGFGGGMPPR